MVGCNNRDYVIAWTHNDTRNVFVLALYVPMKPLPSQCHRGMSSIQNLLNPEADLSSSCESVGFVLVRLSSIDPLCSGQRQQNESGRGQHRPSLHRTQAHIRSLKVALHFREEPNMVIMSHIPIAQTPSPVSQTRTCDHSTHFLSFYVVRY